METQCTAGLIVVGDEILRGQVADTNTSYLAQKLRTVGVKLRKVTVVPDIVDEIAEEVREASAKYSVVFTAGGVGPTHDDVTYEAVAQALGLKLEVHEKLVDLYAKLHADRNAVKRLAIVPTPCEIIYVESTVKYAVIKAGNVHVLPGSPRYFQPAVDTIVAKLRGDKPLHFDYVDVESNELLLLNVLDEHAERWKGKINIGSYPQVAERPFTRITFEGNEEDVVEAKKVFLSSLSDCNIREMKKKFSIDDAKSIVEHSKTEKHVKDALDILQECYSRYDASEVFLSFNGGKDCTVVLHLAATVTALRNVSPPLCLYVAADSFPEVEEFIREAADYYDLELIRKERPLHTALSQLLKERSHLKASLMGIRRGDPGAEKLQAFTITDPHWPNIMRVNPILTWTYNQVWEFLLKHKVPYCSLYNKGYTSLGTRGNTLPNPLLKDPKDPSIYLPAYTLTDITAERQGRE